MVWCFACGAAADGARCAACGADIARAAEDLGTEVERRRFNEREVTLLVAELAELVGLLHARGVAHGALRPAAVGTRVGTEARILLRLPVARTEWSAPEGDGGPAADLYSLGLLAVWLLTRRTPASLRDRTGHLRWTEVVSVHHELVRIVDMMLDAAPDRRPREPGAIADRLRDVAHGASTTFMPAHEAKDTVDDPATMLPSQLEALDTEPTLRRQR